MFGIDVGFLKKKNLPLTADVPPPTVVKASAIAGAEKNKPNVAPDGFTEKPRNDFDKDPSSASSPGKSSLLEVRRTGKVTLEGADDFAVAQLKDALRVFQGQAPASMLSRPVVDELLRQGLIAPAEPKAKGVVATDAGPCTLTPAGAAYADLLGAAEGFTSMKAFRRAFSTIQTELTTSAGFEKKIFDDTKNCDHAASAAYAVLASATGKPIDELSRTHKRMYDDTKDCGDEATGILVSTQHLTGASVEALQADYKTAYDTKNCGDAASALLVYASRTSGKSMSEATSTFTRMYDVKDCGDEAAAVLTLAAFRTGASTDALEKLFLSFYDIDGCGDVAAAMMALEVASGRSSVQKETSCFKQLFDSTKNLGDYEAVILMRSADVSGSSTTFWHKLFSELRGVPDEAAAMLSVGAAAKLGAASTSTLGDLAVMGLVGRGDELSDAKAASAQSAGSGQGSPEASFGYGYGTGYGFGHSGYGYYAAGSKLF